MSGELFHCQMKIVSWNVRGRGGATRRLVVKALLRRHKVQLALFQETKLKGIDDIVIREIWGRKNVRWAAADADGSSGGILILWDSRFISVEKCWVDVFSVSTLVEDLSTSSKWLLTSVYGPNSHRRKEFWGGIKLC